MERRFGYCRTNSGPPVSLHSSQGREESRTGGRIDSISGKVRNAREEIMTKTKGNHDKDMCALMHARHEVLTRRTNVRALRSVPARVGLECFRSQPKDPTGENLFSSHPSSLRCGALRRRRIGPAGLLQGLDLDLGEVLLGRCAG